MHIIFKKLFPSAATRVLLAMYLASLVWWITIFARGIQNTTENFLFNIPLAILPIVGGVFGIRQAKKRRDSMPTLYRAIIFLAVGLIFWGAGNIVYMYYNVVKHIDTPYPSLADVFYLVTQAAWIIGLVYLCGAVGIARHLRLVVGKIIFFCIPCCLIFMSYYFLFLRSSNFFHITSIPFQKFIVDVYGLLPDVIILILISVLLYCAVFESLQKVFRLPIFILSGFILNYIVDITYIYATNHDGFFVASWIDMLFMTAVFLQALGVNLFFTARED